MRLYDDIMAKLYHGHNPYANYPTRDWAGTWYGDPGAQRQMFKTAIDRSCPGLIVEVGSFVGESAIFMAQHLRATQREAVILCIDTWYGGIDHWEKAYEKLRFHFGRPSLYYQFMGNVIARGFSDMIIPLSLDSINGARLLKLFGIVPNMVYVDASHEEGDAVRDYEAYWSLLPKGGVLLVDDLTGWFPGVVKDFDKFIKLSSLNPTIEGEKGMVVKE